MMKKMVKKICKATVLLPLMTLFCFAGFIGSLLIPNTVLDTYVINMTEEEGDTEVLLPLSSRDPILYEMNTNGRSMRGIQIGIDKRNIPYTKAVLSYQVYQNETLLSDNEYDLVQLENLQYVYLPYADYEKVIGDIQIRFFMKEASHDVLPAITANHRYIKDTRTIPAGQIIERETEAEETEAKETEAEETEAEEMEEGVLSLKGNYVYTHETYPFLYDFRILSFLFLAVTMTVSFPLCKKAKNKEQKNEE